MNKCQGAETAKARYTSAIESSQPVFYPNSNTTASNDTFDAAFTHAVLEHLQQPVKALQELYRVLKPDCSSKEMVATLALADTSRCRRGAIAAFYEARFESLEPKSRWAVCSSWVQSCGEKRIVKVF